jgi:hypothetical protein
VRKKEAAMKICLVASAGGHLSQLLKIVQAVNGYEAFVVTTSEAVRENLTRFGQVHVVGECNRQRLKSSGLPACWRIRARDLMVLSTGRRPAACVVFWVARGAKLSG